MIKTGNEVIRRDLTSGCEGMNASIVARGDYTSVMVSKNGALLMEEGRPKRELIPAARRLANMICKNCVSHELVSELETQAINQNLAVSSSVL